MRSILLSLFAGIISIVSSSQSIILHSGVSGLYVKHRVATKENFYSIGRMYKIHPRHLISYNNLDISKGLSIGQIINIPLTDTNLNRKVEKGVPVLYEVLQSQTMEDVSAITKTTSSTIHTWNKLNAKNLLAGSKIIIGYLMAADISTPVESEGRLNSLPETNQIEKQSEAALPKPSTDIGMKGSCYFKTNFEQQIKVFPLSKEEIVTAGIFKTTSGWNDGKYYALLDNIEPATIIRVTNIENNKVIFAKVLGKISRIRENQGLSLRISNAAAAALQINNMNKFIVKLNY